MLVLLKILRKYWIDDPQCNMYQYCAFVKKIPMFFFSYFIANHHWLGQHLVQMVSSASGTDVAIDALKLMYS